MSSHTKPRRRPAPTAPNGYALLAVLWICMGVAALGVVIGASARDAVARSRNRVALAQAEWLARGCLVRARARIAGAFAPAPPPFAAPFAAAAPGAEAWARLDSVVAPAAGEGPCAVTARAAGATLDVNAAPDSLVAAVLRNAGVPAGRADSLAAAIADWKDADDDPRPLGAERAWYEARRLPAPANRPFLDAREIGRVRGMDAVAWRDVLGVDGGPIVLQHAHPAVLATLPGFGPEAVARAMALRVDGRLDQYRAIADGLSPSASVAFMDALPALVARAVIAPAAWTVRAEASAGTPPVTAAAEMRLERPGETPVIDRQRVEFP